MFDRRLPLAPLARLCRSLATLLGSGVPLMKSLATAASKTGDPAVVRHLDAVAADVSNGRELHAALAARDGAFPRLTVDLVRVAEETGHLPETLTALAHHYENLLRLRKAFLSQIAWPVFQLLAAVCVIGLLIWILGLIGDSGFDILGLGLTGSRGAAIWFGSAFGIAALGVVIFAAVKRSLRWRRLFDPVLLAIPVVGTCLRNFALARFSWAFALTQNSGMDIRRSLEASFSATENGAFAAANDEVWARVSGGEELTDALRATNLFPRDYLEMVMVAESSGSVPEMLDRISPDLEADARRSLSALAAAVGWCVWALVAGFIIWVIFSVATQYVGMITDAANGNFDRFDR